MLNMNSISWEVAAKRIQVKFAPQVCTKTDLSWDLDGQTKSFMHEGHSSQVLLRVIEIDDSSFIHSFIHLIILGRMTCEHRQ